MSVLIRHSPVLNRHRQMMATCLHLQADVPSTFALPNLGNHWQAHPSLWIAMDAACFDDRVLHWALPAHASLVIPAALLDTQRALVRELQRQQVPLVLASDDGMRQPGFRHVCSPHLGEKQIVTHLASASAYSEALDAGIEGATGWFCLNPDTRPDKPIGPSHAQIIQVLNLVRANAEIEEIEAALKRDVSLAFKLLRYINSAGFGLMREVGSFRQAVTIVGYNKLNRWLSLLLVNASQAPFAQVLMQAAVIRGRYMEALAELLDLSAERDNLFITGAFSLLDILLGVRLDTLLDQLKLPDTVRTALLEGSGNLAPLLQLARLLETGSEAEVRAQLHALGLDPEASNRALVDALDFAARLQFE